MIVFTNVSPLDIEEYRFRKKALRDATICIAWVKFCSITCYLCLYFLVVFFEPKGDHAMSTVIQVMTAITIIPLVVQGLLLLLGAVDESHWALEAAIWLCIIVAAYDTVLGIMGCVFYIRCGHEAMHFLLATVFALLALSLCPVLCHDVLIIYAYKKYLGPPPRTENA